MHMNHNFLELHTKRLSLKRLLESDWQEISFLRSDPEVNKFVKRPSAQTQEEALAFIQKIDGFVNNEISYYWKITLINSQKMIGSICLWNFSEDRKTAEVGYDLHPDFQGKGVMSEALDRLIVFSGTQLNLNVLEAYTHGENEHSIRLLEGRGFTRIVGRKDPDNADNIVLSLKLNPKK